MVIALIYSDIASLVLSFSDLVSARDAITVALFIRRVISDIAKDFKDITTL
jgi:hypothetical protein